MNSFTSMNFTSNYERDFINTIVNIRNNSIEPIHHIYDNIYLGDMRAGYSKELQQKYNIKYVIRLNNFDEKKEENVKKIKINDKVYTNILSAIIESLKYYMNILKNDKGKNILIHCNYGKSRSASIVIALLMCSLNIPYETAYHMVKTKRQCINPNEYYKYVLYSNQKFIKNSKFYLGYSSM